MNTQNQKRYLILGAGGMIGHQMTNRLKKDGNWVRGVDLVYPKFSNTNADEFIIGDLRDIKVCEQVITEDIDVIIQLAAELGGALYVFTGENDAEIIHNSALINLNVANVAADKGVKKIAYSSSACFVEGTPILTKNGNKPIESIIVGDEVLTHKGEFKKVLKTTSNLYIGKMQKLKVSGVPEIHCTSDHRFFNGKTWIAAKDLQKNSKLSIPKQKNRVGKPNVQLSWELPVTSKIYSELKANPKQSIINLAKKLGVSYSTVYAANKAILENRAYKFKDPVLNEKIVMDKKAGEICGLFLSEGWVERSGNSSYKPSFAFGEEPELIELLTTNLNSVFGIPKEKIRLHKMKTQNGYKVQISSNLLGKFFKENFYNENGKYCYHKTITPFLLNQSDEFLAGLVRGFWLGDGSFQRRDSMERYIFSSTSLDLIKELRSVMLSMGIYTSLSERYQPKQGVILGRKVNIATSYTLYNIMENDSAEKLAELLENKKFENRCKQQNNDEDYWFRPVEHNEEYDYEGKVFNLEVEEDHSYTVYGIATHNCIYPKYNQTDPNNPNCTEGSAYPAFPDSVYGWEKLFSEILYDSYMRNKGLEISIMRFHNIFSEECDYYSNRAKAPAALCRKVAEAKDGTHIEIFGDGNQTRSFLYIDECIEGTLRLIENGYRKPMNIGSDEMISINDLAKMIIDISGKKLDIKHISGPIGVMGRNSDNRLIKETLGWAPSQPLKAGIEKLYKWVNKQVNI